MSEKASFSRKKFVLAAGAVAGAAGLAAHPESAEAAHSMEPPVVAAAKTAAKATLAAPLGNEPEAYTYLTMPEAAFVEAAVDRLIPTDDLGPGAKPAGVAFYIDQQLEGAVRLRRQDVPARSLGPGSPDAGLSVAAQSARSLSPRHRGDKRLLHANVRQDVRQAGRRASGSGSDRARKGANSNSTDVPSSTFFGMLYGNTVEGFFADPLYGGNRDKVGWKMIGFPGVAAAYYRATSRSTTCCITSAPVASPTSSMRTGLAMSDGAYAAAPRREWRKQSARVK